MIKSKFLKRIHIMKEEWNVLIILDATRYDIFETLNDIKGTLEKVESLNTGTWMWIQDNFKKPYPNLIYVSGNPMVSKFKLSKIGLGDYFKIIDAWDIGWDSELNGVRPEPVTRIAIDTIKKYPNKRILIHYLQPHFPWLENPETNRGRGLLLEWTENKEKKHLHQMNTEEKKRFKGIMWDYVKMGKASVEECREGYISNFIIVMEEVKKLLKEIPKDKIVIISADHGECLGFPTEKGYVGHGPNLHEYRSLLEIPWFKVNLGEI